jgi:hypothetical protein
MTGAPCGCCWPALPLQLTLELALRLALLQLPLLRPLPLLRALTALVVALGTAFSLPRAVARWCSTRRGIGAGRFRWGFFSVV